MCAAKPIKPAGIRSGLLPPADVPSCQPEEMWAQPRHERHISSMPTRGSARFQSL